MQNSMYKQWLEDFNNQKQSGLGVSCWCKKHGLKTSTFYSRITVLKKMRFIENTEIKSSINSENSYSKSNFIQIALKPPVEKRPSNVIACTITTPSGINITITNEISPLLLSTILGEITNAK